MTELGWRCGFVTVALITIAIRSYYDAMQGCRKDISRDSHLLTRGVVVGLCSCAAPYQLVGVELLPMNLDPAVDWLVKSVGILITIIGSITFCVSRANRPNTWAGPMTLPDEIKNHFVCTKGMYAYVRHPTYLGMICAVAGFELIWTSWMVIPVVASYAAYWDLVARHEENDLIDAYGEAYRAYKNRSWRFVPFIF